MMKLTHRLSDMRPPKPIREPVLCVGKNGGAAGFAVCAGAPVGFRKATGAGVDAPMPQPYEVNVIFT
jgi:hypothetical protein